MRVTVLRHGKTESNLQHRYLGRTDEELCPLGREELLRKKEAGIYPAQPDCAVCSPMRRCIQTLQLLYPKLPFAVEQELRETDFGAFEGKTYEQLKDDAAYQQWLATNCEGPVPQGESRAQMSQRCCAAFARQVERAILEGKEQLLIVAHGGSVMAILERYAAPAQEFYQFHVENGDGYCLEVDSLPLGRCPVRKVCEEEL